MRKTLIAAALTAGILSSTAIAAQQDQFSALQGIEAQPMSTQEMAAVEGQIEGSVVQGLGWALTEGFDYGTDGRLRNASMLDYRMPTALDVPPIEAVIIETPVPDVPYGLRGVGEVPIVPVAGCIANAIARAIGARVTQMPMTPERVLRAVKTGAAD